MLRITVGASRAAGWLLRPATLFSLAFVLLLAQSAQAQPGNLTFFKNYLVTGDYVTGGVGLRGLGGDTGIPGIAAGTITISGVPENADILAAFLFWETVLGNNQSLVPTGATFRHNDTFVDNDISTIAFNINPAGTSPCWSSGGATGAPEGAHRLRVYRADVLRFLPVPGSVVDGKFVPTGKRYANGTYTVALPDAGSGNQVPSTAGASLVVVYRDPNPSAALRSIVIYNGGHTMDQTNGGMTQAIRGFYQQSTSRVAKMTHIVGDGQPDKDDQTLFNGNVLAWSQTGGTLVSIVDSANTSTVTTSSAHGLVSGDGVRISGVTGDSDLNGAYTITVTSPTEFTITTANVTNGTYNNLGLTVAVAFNGALGPASDPAWDTSTFGNLTLPGNTDSATVTVDHDSFTPFDCLSWGAIIFSTTDLDLDGDGLPDFLESTTSTLYDPSAYDPITGSLLPGSLPLPNLQAMGASPTHKDLFVEIGFMTTGGYSYPGSIQGPVPAHSHRPFYEALKLMGDAFNIAPVVGNPDGLPGIKVHFDLPDFYQTNFEENGVTYHPVADGYIIPSSLARGGESIVETACDPDAVPCLFPDYPGTVGWKTGYRFYRDEPLNYASEADCLAHVDCVRRFDSVRKSLFHYALFAHLLGMARHDDPNTIDIDESLPGVPVSNSGIGDFPGGDIMVSLGFFDDFVGTPFIQGSTLMHEMGHNLWRRHGGDLGQPNCKPNYESVMNYLFQIRGVLSATGNPLVRFSGQVLGSLDENNLNESAGLGPMLYRTRWYAPLTSSFIDLPLGTTAASKHCDGTFLFPLEWADKQGGGGMVRVDGTSVTPPINWDADATPNEALVPPQDISFNGFKTLLAAGSNDWDHIDLRQVGSRRNVASLGGLSGLFGGHQSLDLGDGDVGDGDVGDGDVGDGDVGDGDVGDGDVGDGDVGDGDVGVSQEVSLENARALGNAPNSLTATPLKKAIKLDWKPAFVDVKKVTKYELYRVIGSTVNSTNFAARVLVTTLLASTSAPPPTTFTDTTVKNNQYTYFVLAEYNLGGPVVRSGVSNYATASPGQ